MSEYIHIPDSNPVSITAKNGNAAAYTQQFATTAAEAPLDRDYSYGLNRLGNKMVEGATVISFGDSYNQSYMPMGRMRMWRPNNWVGAAIPNTNAILTNSIGPSTVGPAGSGAAREPYNTDLSEYDTSAPQWPIAKAWEITSNNIPAVGSIWQGWFNRAGMGNGGSFSAGTYINADGTQNYFLASGYEATMILATEDNTVPSIQLWQSGNSWSSASSGTKWNSKITLGPDPSTWSSALAGPTFKASTNNAYGSITLENDSTGSDYSDYYYGMAASDDSTSYLGKRVGASLFGFKSTEATDGMFLASLGMGGKTAVNLSDAVDQEYLKFVSNEVYPADVIMIQFGHNEFSSNVTPAQLKINLQNCINELRSGRLNEDVRFLVVVGNVTKADGVTPFETQFDDLSGLVRELVDENADVAMLDMYNRIKDTVGLYQDVKDSGFYEESNPNSGVHPLVGNEASDIAALAANEIENLSGASMVAYYEWEEIKAVYDILNPPTPSVDTIKLFASSDPTGTELSSPVVGQSVFAYGFDSNGNVVTGDLDFTFTEFIADFAPIWTSTPTKVGDIPQEGDTISVTADASMISAQPVATITYDWQKDGVSTGNTTSSLVTQTGDGGSVYTCIVTATNSEGSAAETVTFGAVTVGLTLVNTIVFEATTDYSSGIDGYNMQSFTQNFSDSADEFFQAHGNKQFRVTEGNTSTAFGAPAPTWLADNPQSYCTITIEQDTGGFITWPDSTTVVNEIQSKTVDQGAGYPSNFARYYFDDAILPNSGMEKLQDITGTSDLDSLKFTFKIYR